MILYIYSKCSTCKDAVRFLNQQGVVVITKEITETPPSVQELSTMLDYYNRNIKKLFNTSGNLYREMGLSEKLEHLSTEEALKLLSSHGMLVKRPFLLGNGFGLLGFHPEEWSKKLERSLKTT